MDFLSYIVCIWRGIQLFTQRKVILVCIFIMQNNLAEHLQKKGKIDLTLLKQLLSQDKQLPVHWVKKLIKQFTGIISQQPNLIKLSEPIVIVGDIHGQYFDLLKILSLLPNLQTSKDNILFLGDYVDRGPQGIQVILLLMAFKIVYPRQVYMIRGNHESRQMTQIMNFYRECLDKYNQDIYFDIMDAFDALPLVCIVNQHYFCVHGGITSLGQSLPEIQKINRFIQVPTEGSLCDLLWADPVQNDIGALEGDEKYVKNHQRNCSIFFGQEHTRKFLKQNRLLTIIRAHEVQLQGYKEHIWPNWKNIPMVYTVFSAPNYCGSYGNLGAILTINNNKFHVRQFKFANPKYYVPEKFDAFNFTLPKLFDYLDHISKKISVNWAAKYMSQNPDVKNLSGEDVIKLLLATQKCQKMLRSKRESSELRQELKNQSGHSDTQSLFRRSCDYFSISQKRPNSLVYIPK